MDKTRRVRKVSSPQHNPPATSSNGGKSSNLSTKFTIEQKVAPDPVKKGPYSVKRALEPNDLIKRRLGEGSKPIFSRSDIRVNRSPSSKKSPPRRDSSSNSSSPDNRNRYRTNSTKSQAANKRESADKVPYFMDQKREKDRIERAYGRSRRSRSSSYERRKRSPVAHHSRYRTRRSSSRDRYRLRHRTEYSHSRSRSRERRRRNRRNESTDDRLQPMTQFIPIPVPMEYPYMPPAWGTPMMPPPPRFPYMMRPALPPPMQFVPRQYRPPRYMQNSYGRGYFRPRQY